VCRIVSKIESREIESTIGREGRSDEEHVDFIVAGALCSLVGNARECGED
jgi:hypothetical protein